MRSVVPEHRRKAGDADRDVRRALSERPPERVGDDHPHLDAGQLGDASTNGPRARVRIDRQEDECPVLGRVRVVDPRGGADEAVTGLGDHERAALPHDSLRLTQDDLDLTWIALVRGELDRLRRRFIVVDPHDAALGLRDRLLREDEYIARLQLDQLDDERGEIVVLPDLRQAANGDELDHRTPVTRTPACAL